MTSAPFRPLRFAVTVFAAVCAVYLLSAVLLGRLAPQPFSYFDQLAEAFLHGRLYLESPGQTHDLAKFRGRWYVPFPPLPALLMLPWLALFPTINTTLFSIAVAAAGVTFMALALRQAQRNGLCELSPAAERLLIALYALGSVHWYMAIDGNVWFLSQICVSTALTLALWLALRGSAPWLVGSALAAAVLGRPHVVLFAALLIAIDLQRRGLPRQRSELPALLRRAAAFSLPLLLAGAALLAYNQARFGNPLNFGYLIQNIAVELRADLYHFGQFHLNFVPRNLAAMLWLLPDTNNRHGLWLPNMDGMSMLLTMPALLLMFGARGPRALLVGAWLSIALLLIPLLTYYNTGWQQFGYRFSLDFLPAALLLTACGAGRHPRLLRWLVGYGIVINLLGAIWFHLLR